MKQHCQCPDDSMDNPNPPSAYLDEEQNGRCHEPNKCPCTNDVFLYKRGEQKLWLCSCCNLSGDILVDNQRNESGCAHERMRDLTAEG